MTDVMQSLGHAIDIVRRLREMNEKVKNSDFANLIADLNLEFADVKLKLAGVMEENLKLKERIRTLEALKADPCPKCRKRTYELESSQPDPTFGEMGTIRRTYKCTDCGFSERKLITPEG
jgi:hypothetical protein